MTRPRNPRVTSVAVLRGVKRRVTALLDTWTGLRVTSYVNDYPDRREGGDGIVRWGQAVRRKRQPDEYPEADPQEWVHMYYQVDAMIKELKELRDLAAHHHNDLIKK